MRLIVTREDVIDGDVARHDKGNFDMCEDCPGAKAIRRQLMLPPDVDVYVGVHCAGIGMTVWNLSDPLQRDVHGWDWGMSNFPLGSYEMQLAHIREAVND